MKSKVFGFITVFTAIFLATPHLTQAADVNSQLADFEGSFTDFVYGNRCANQSAT